MIPEYVVVELPPDEDEPLYAELQVGTAVDVSDPRLTEEVLEMDLEANAYATHVALKILIDSSGQPDSIAVRWN